MRNGENDLKIKSMRYERLRLVANMAGGLAHELNQPLSGINMFAENVLCCLQQDLPLTHDEILHAMTRIIEQVDRMSKMIEHLRDFARESDRSQVMNIKVRSVIESAAKIVQAQFNSRDIAFEMEFSRDDIHIKINPFALEEVLMNLLWNARDALDACPRMNKEVRVKVFEKQKTNFLHEHIAVIEVSDTGEGVSQESIDEIFDPFFSTKETHQRMGLGLSISRSIVEEFNGSLDLRSDEEGTIVSLEFPLMEKDEIDAPEILKE